MLNLAAFRSRFPEFESATDDLINSVLSESTKEIGTVWGDLEDTAHGLLTAHRLSISPQGQFARLDPKSGETTYGKEYSDLLNSKVSIIRVF